MNNVFNADVKDGSFGNVWNITKTEGTNIAGGPYLGGNFWAKPDDTGFSQTATDEDGDGIADIAYKFSGNINADFLPLVGGSESKQPVLPLKDLDTSEIETGSNKTETNHTEITTNETKPVANKKKTIANGT